jgi:hypothetical protein
VRPPWDRPRRALQPDDWVRLALAAIAVLILLVALAIGALAGFFLFTP